MTTRMLRGFPQLPVLPMGKSMQIIKLAKLGDTLCSDLTGFSRVAFYKWGKGGHDNANSASLEAVSTLAYKVLRALKHKHFPLQKSRSVDASSLDALSDHLYEKPLSETMPQELLPNTWLAQLNIPREQHEPESIL